MKISLESFLAVLRRSGLVPPERLQTLLDKFQQQRPGDAGDAKLFSDALVTEGVLTDWQCEKLLQGKHKGFFLGKYRLLRLLGKGGMSSVYLAEHVLMRRRCAIKVLPAKRVNDTSYLGRFHREAQAVASLDHPNIVRAYDVDHEQDGNVEIHFLVMEYVDGMSLFDMINRDGRLSPVAAAEYIRQSAHGLEHAHRAGLIHRDIKPGNLLVDTSGVVKVMDLGLARFFAGQDEESLTIQYDEKVLGTADYLAPEQAVDSHDIDARADIYSLGCTLYFLLTGHPPFNQGTLPQRLMAHQSKEPPPVTAERQDVPESLLAILRKMMAKRATERYQSAVETAEELTAWLRQHGGDAWTAMRARLADSGVDVASGSGPATANTVPSAKSTVPNPQTSPTVVAPKPKDIPSQPTAAPAKKPAPVTASVDATPRISTVGEAAKVIKKSPSVAPRAAVVAPITPPVAAKAPAAGHDAELGAFLSQLSNGDGGPTAPAVQSKDSAVGTPPIEPAPVSRTRKVEPATSKSTASKKGRDSVPVFAPVQTAPTPTAVATQFQPEGVEPDGETAWSAASRKTDEEEIVATLATTEQPAGESETAPGEGPTSLAGRKKQRTQRRLIYAVAGGVGVLLLVVAIAVMSGGDDAPDNTTVPGAGQAGTPEGQTTNPAGVAAAPRRPLPESPREMTVGPEGNFATINEALRYALDNQPLTDRREPRVIRVKGGTVYAERIDLSDWNLGMLHVLSDGPERAILRPAGDGPLINLNNCALTRIEGFTLDATEKPVAIRLQGPLPEVQLVNLRVTGFTQTGIEGDQAKGLGGWLELRDLYLQSASASATGVRLVDTAFGLEKTTIAGLRIVGPMEAGLRLSGTVREVVIRQNRLSNLQTALVVEGANTQLEQARIENNTFHRVARGILFATTPTSGRRNVIVNNLFADVSGPEVEFTTAPDPQLPVSFATEGQVAFNWTTRPADAVAQLAWNLFADQGQAAVTPPAFVSTDPESGDFLKPVGDQLRSPESPGNEKFIGAVSP